MNYKVITDSFKNRKSIRKKLVFTSFAVGLGLTASVWGQVPNYVPTNGLVGWWPFNGNANDESGNGNNGTVNGATLTTDRFGNANKAYSFDGVDDNLIVSSLSFQNSKTISIWFYNTNSSQLSQLLYQATNSIDHYIDNNQKLVIQEYPIWNYTSSVIVNLNQWYHSVWVFNGNQLSLYVDGIQIYSTSEQIQGTMENIHFGSQLNNYGFFKGKLDDIGIWNRALTDQEISDLYNANICYEYVTVTDTLVINTGITGYNPITYLNTLKIWPNPSNDHITIDAGNLATMNGYSIKIEDAQGQQVFQNAINQQQFYIDITTWGGNGLYFVRIIDPQGNTVDIKKIVLQ